MALRSEIQGKGKKVSLSQKVSKPKERYSHPYTGGKQNSKQTKPEKNPPVSRSR